MAGQLHTLRDAMEDKGKGGGGGVGGGVLTGVGLGTRLHWIGTRLEGNT